MYDKNYFHGDIKPYNIVIVYENIDNKNFSKFIIKLIDFGGATYKWEYQPTYTPIYFNSFKRKKYYNRSPLF